MKIKLGELRRLMKEVLDESMLAPHASIELAIEKMVDTWIEDQKASFDPSDPTMARSGEKEWHTQVAMAGRELEERMLEAADGVMDRLHGGEFYHGTPKVTSPKIPF